MEKYLSATYFIESEHVEIKKIFKEQTSIKMSAKEKAIKLFYWLRDNIAYKPLYFNFIEKEELKATTTLKRGIGNCLMKSIVLISLMRCAKIPTKFILSEIKYYNLPQMVIEALESKIMPHGLLEIFLNDKWIKIDPSFDIEYCKENNFYLTEFDGENEALFVSINKNGEKSIDYTKFIGSYADFPYDFFFQYIKEKYGKLEYNFLEKINKGYLYYKGWA